MTEDDLRRGQVTPQVAALLAFECDRAHDYYRRAAWQLPPADAGSLVAAEIMGGIYFGILSASRRRATTCSPRASACPARSRALIALRIWLRTLLGMRRRSPVPKPTDSSVEH